MLLQKTKEGGRGAATAMSCTRALSSAQKQMGFDTRLYRHLICFAGQGTLKEPLHPKPKKSAAEMVGRGLRPLKSPPATPKKAGTERDLSEHTRTLTLQGKADYCEAQVQRLILADGKPYLLQ